MRREARLLAGSDRQVIQAGRQLTRKLDERLVRQRAQRDATASGEPMTGRHSRDQRLAEDRAHRQARSRRWQYRETEIELARLQQRLLAIAGQLQQLQGDSGMLLPEAADQRRQDAVVDGADEAEGEPANGARGGAADMDDRRFGLVEQAAAVVEQHATGLGELDAALGADQQRRADLSLEGADLHAERRLREVEPPGGAAEMQFLGDGHEVAKAAQVRRVHTESVSIRANQYIGPILGAGARLPPEGAYPCHASTRPACQAAT